MSNAVPNAKLTGALQGSTSEGALTAITWAYMLSDQDVHLQGSVCVDQADVNKAVAFPAAGPASAGQTLFLLKPDTDVRVRLNGANDLTFNLAAEGAFVLAGTPEITLAEFTGIASTTARVFYTKILDGTALPTPPGAAVPQTGGLFSVFENIGPAVAAQTSFTLLQPPANPANVLFMVDGVTYTTLSGEIGVVGNIVTWNNISFTMAGGERIEVLY